MNWGTDEVVFKGKIRMRRKKGVISNANDENIANSMDTTDGIASDKKRNPIVNETDVKVNKGKNSKNIISVDKKHGKKRKEEKHVEFIENTEMFSTGDKTKLERKKKRKNVNDSVDKELSDNEESAKDSVISNSENVEEKPKKKLKEGSGQLYVPSKREINESSKPENTKKTLSKRQMKRDKNAARLALMKLESDKAWQLKVLNYLSLWKCSNTEWKFEKKKNIWVLRNIFDDGKLPDDVWENVLEYLKGSQGNGRKMVVDRAIKIIEAVDADEAETNVEKETEGTDKQAFTPNQYKRARTVVQFLE